MKLRFEQLAGNLRQGLAKAYLVCGDEPWQQLRAADMVRKQAQAAGYSDRRVLEAGKSFDWNALAFESSALSLFSEMILLDLRLPGGKPGAEGSRALAAWAKDPPEGTVLLVTAGRLDRKAMNGAWVRALDAAGVVLQVWPLTGRTLSDWVTARFRESGLEATREAVQYLVARVEGNLLAADQEIEKLALLRPPGRLDTDSLMAAVSDSARYDVFDLSDALLAGDVPRSVAVLDALRGEGTPEVLVLWSIANAVRVMVAAAYAAQQGQAPPPGWPRFPRERVALYRQALRRVSRPRWEELLRRCARTDARIKSDAGADKWQELLQLAIAVTGRGPKMLPRPTRAMADWLLEA
ncbi:MAG: DNA polymerase III subunit delta [Gammaproteobacteria bacterium]|jgi:DNA polymerase-3 subunit delta|nr:DNA polymerase III subunit delta [Gammaproteobacteria bacterium]